MVFDPIKLRENGYNGEMIRYIVSREYDEKRPMGNVACGDLDNFILASLLGLHNEVAEIISSRVRWIENAIVNDEDFGVNRNAHRGKMHFGKAIGEWLLNGENDFEAWSNARVYEEAKWNWEGGPWSMREILKDGLADYMAFSYQGGKYNKGYEAGIETYQRCTGKHGPVTLKKILKPHEFAYALCLQNAEIFEFDEHDLFNAGCQMLQANLQEKWLGAGQIMRAAMWLKIVYWHHDKELTPLQTILKAYENMPDVKKPYFL